MQRHPYTFDRVEPTSPDSDIATTILTSGGETGALLREIDWSRTSLGPVEAWPQSLKTAIQIMLTCAQPMFVWWGPELINLYNDAYRAVMGGKHPEGLGQPAAMVWQEIWDQVGPRAEAAMQTNEGTFDDGLLLIMERYGYKEETYYTFSYSPVPDDQGNPGGIICASTEETRKVIGERRLQTLRDLSAQAAVKIESPDIACRAVIETLKASEKDIPFACLYLAETSETGTSHTYSTHSGLETQIWSIIEMICSEPQILENLSDKVQILAKAWQMPVEKAMVLPLGIGGQEGVKGVLVVGISPLRPFDEDYQAFFDLVASQIGMAIANARSFEGEKKRAEALAEIDRTKTAFFSNVSHEFRTPLTLMLGPIEEALNDSGTIADNHERLNMAYRNALRLQKLVNSLLDFSRIEAGRVQAFYQSTDLSEYTTELASTFRSTVEKAGLKLIVDCPPLPEPIHIDQDMWEKIVLNLLSNAFKHTFEGKIEVKLRWLDGRAELRVQDTGIGIPNDQLSHLFERFHRVPNARSRTYEGTGIGLALIHELVKLHGGTITVESVVDQGTTFIICVPGGKAHLPADRVDQKSRLTPTALGAQAFVEEALRWLPDDQRNTLAITVDTVTPISEGRHATWRGALHPDKAQILLVDDNVDMRQYVYRLLEPYCDVKAVSNGAAALETAQRETPDLIISDVMMPGMDGFELLGALRADIALQAIPVILLSARAGEEAKVEGLQAGADDYLVKPFSARELLARVKANLDLARVRQEAQVKLERSNRELEQFATIASHDLRAPLRKIVTFANALKQYDGERLSKDGFDSLVRIERSAEKMQVLINDLLILSSVTRHGKPFQPVDLQKLVSDIAGDLQDMIDETQGRIEVGALPVIQGDDTQLRQLLQNLIENGLKFHRQGVPPIIQILYLQQTESIIEISVRDNGIGFDMVHAERVFQIFERLHSASKYPGTGVGLAIVKKIAERHDGDITAQSQLGEGSVFTLTFPSSSLLQVPPSSFGPMSKEIYAASCSLSETQQTILIVEDDPDLLDFAANYLSTLGYQVLTAMDAKEAFSHLEKAEPIIHLLFSDIRLPGGGINGIAIAQKAKQLRPEMQVLITTGFDETFLKETNSDEFPVLLKPYFLDELAQTLRKLLDRTEP